MQDKIYLILEIKHKVIPVLKKAKVKRAILFGSYAKGIATSKSDIDIFIKVHKSEPSPMCEKCKGLGEKYVR